jgi:hypothetical protein
VVVASPKLTLDERNGLKATNDNSF